jgi:biotin carboxyl carrier protein
MKKTFIVNGEHVQVENYTVCGDKLEFCLAGQQYHFLLRADEAISGAFVLHAANRPYQGYIGKPDAHKIYKVFLHGGIEASVAQKGRADMAATAKHAPHTAPMPGTVLSVQVKAGEVVKKGQTLAVMEAMKLQLTIEAAYDGTVKAVCCEAGSLVQDGALLLEIANDA